MLIDGFVFLSQEQINMLALTAEPPPDSWLHPMDLAALPILLAPEWPEKVEWGDWVIFSMDGTVYGMQPEVIKANMERAILESGGLHFLPSIENQIGLYQQRPFTDWISGIV